MQTSMDDIEKAYAKVIGGQSGLLDNLHNFRQYDDWLSWISALNGIPKDEVNEKIDDDYLIEGCCEDFGVYFCIKYGIPLWKFDDAHFILIVDGRYYDGFNNYGVDSLRDLEFVKRYDGIGKSQQSYRNRSDEELRSLLELDEEWKTYRSYTRCSNLISKLS